MKISLAPLEGVTGYIVRNAFHHNFGGIDTYYTPFIPAGKSLSKKVIRDILPENNEGITLIPQLMSNRAGEVIDMGHKLAEFGYHTVNLNLGCPSGTVTSKKRGSGLLLYPEELDQFLEEVYSHTDMKVSVKTRIGFNSPDEWPKILEIYKKYPIDELIIHPRVRAEFYSKVPHLDCFEMAYDYYCRPANCAGSTDSGNFSTELCYNGDIVSLDCYHTIKEHFPALQNIMIGRGLLSHPGLAAQIKAGLSSADPSVCSAGLSAGFVEYGHVTASLEYREQLREFHDEIFAGFLSIFSGEKDAMLHMKEIWGFLGDSFADSDRILKQIRKSQSYAEYKVIVDELFRNPDRFPVIL